ncbi:hypothetical protein CMI37_29750 [Candidatus Pacearchaeota archaeon]|nr:hypothetical protein [Candidatus Pacearchaeota archaeon]|tara:strand:+ start:197 stop:406 length:210 start_codon:yes stop_codon:yes gene_type:complete
MDAIKTILINTPVLNVLFITLFNGVYVKHVIKKLSEQRELSRDEIRIILNDLDMKLSKEEIENYLSDIE